MEPDLIGDNDHKEEGAVLDGCFDKGGHADWLRALPQILPTSRPEQSQSCKICEKIDGTPRQW